MVSFVFPYQIKISRKHAYIILTPLNPTLGYTGEYIIFLLKSIDCGFSLEPPHRGGSTKYQQYMFWAEYEDYQNFYLKIFMFWW